jgi:hypothetical protein
MFTKNFRFFGQILHFTMAYPNFRNGPKNGLRPLGVNPMRFSQGVNSLCRDGIILSSGFHSY